MTDQILCYDKEVGTRASENIILLSADDQIGLKQYLIGKEVENPAFALLPVGWQVRSMQIFKDHEMTNGQKMTILAEYVVRKAEPVSYLESINIFITDEDMPDLFLDIMNFHRQSGAERII